MWSSHRSQLGNVLTWQWRARNAALSNVEEGSDYSTQPSSCSSLGSYRIEVYLHMAIASLQPLAFAPVTSVGSIVTSSCGSSRSAIVSSICYQQLLVRSASFNAVIWKNRSFRTQCSSVPAEDTHESEYLDELRVPQAWVAPEVATQEAEWLRGALHQWLDDEYCPEPANEEISKRCAKVFYYCLLEQQLDVGDILMQMVRGLETFSFKESFHGAFSSANAAIDLITKRMRALDNKTY